MKKVLLSLMAAGLLVAFLATAVLAQPPLTATVEFGTPDAGSPFPFPPPPQHDASQHAKDKMVPRTVVISVGQSVTYNIAGFHQVAIFGPGTEPGDIVVSGPEFWVNDPASIALSGVGGSWTTPAGTFGTPGRYLVICNVAPHFLDADMYGWVIVQ